MGCAPQKGTQSSKKFKQQQVKQFDKPVYSRVESRLQNAKDQRKNSLVKDNGEGSSSRVVRWENQHTIRGILKDDNSKTLSAGKKPLDGGQELSRNSTTSLQKYMSEREKGDKSIFPRSIGFSKKGQEWVPGPNISPLQMTFNARKSEEIAFNQVDPFAKKQLSKVKFVTAGNP